MIILCNIKFFQAVIRFPLKHFMTLLTSCICSNSQIFISKIFCRFVHTPSSTTKQNLQVLISVLINSFSHNLLATIYNQRIKLAYFNNLWLNKLETEISSSTSKGSRDKWQTKTWSHHSLVSSRYVGTKVPNIPSLQNR